MPNLVKITETERSRLGLVLDDYIQGGKTQKGSMSSWWAAVERMFRNEAPTVSQKGVEPVHIPLAQPRLDMLTAQVCCVVGKQKPYMLATNQSDTEKQSRLQDAVHMLWEAADFEGQMEKAAENCGNLNAALWKLTPKLLPTDSTGSGGQLAENQQSGPGVQQNILHPDDVVVYPAGRGGIEQALFVGERFYRTLGECKSLCSAGYYYKKGSPTGGSDPGSEDATGRYAHSRTTLADMPGDMDQELVCLWTGIATLSINGEKLMRYVVTWAEDTQELLMAEPYPYSRVWYFIGRYLPSGTQFWGSRSVGRNLTGLNNYYNNLHSALYTGAMESAKPPKIGPKLAEKYESFDWGDYIETDEPVQPWSQSITFRGDPLVQQILNTERVADQVAGVSQNTMGSTAGRSTTATTDSIIAAGVAVRLEKFITNFIRPLSSMAALTCEIVAKTKDLHQTITAFYGDKFKAPLELFQESTLWMTNGRTPNAIPQVKQQEAKDIFAMAQDPETGLNKHEVVKVILQNSSLSGTDGLQLTKQEMDQMKQAQMQAQAQAQAQAMMAEMEKRAANAKPTQQPDANEPRGNTSMAPVPNGIPAEVMDAVGVLQGGGGVG